MADEAPPKTGTINIALRDKKVLFATYIGFLQNGGLFIPTTKAFNMNDDVSLVVTLLEEVEKFAVTGKIAWITPKGAQGNRTPGIGVHFMVSDTASQLRDKIETALAGSLNSENPTYTM